MRPPYFRPYGAQAFTRAVSASARTSVPRFWRIYLALWLIRRWRLPATPCLILPVAVSLKRFFTPLLVFSLGIFSPLLEQTSEFLNRHGSPFGRAVRSISNSCGKRGRIGAAPQLGKERVDGAARAGTERRSDPPSHHPRGQSGGRDRLLRQSVRRSGGRPPHGRRRQAHHARAPQDQR